MKSTNTLQFALDSVRKRLSEAQEEIGIKLAESINPQTVKILKGNRKYGSQGIKTNNNDYRDFFWIKVAVNNSIYWITLFYNDVDKGNFHTQIGRIQFWQNISCEINPIGTPHSLTANGHWYFCSENADDPSTWIDDENYSATNVVEKFLCFLENSKEENVRNTKE